MHISACMQFFAHIFAAPDKPARRRLRLRPPRLSTWIRRLQNFKSATTGVASSAMKNELNRLVATERNPQLQQVCSWLL